MVETTTELPFSFPNGPADAAEWPGTPIGQSNVISRIKGRTQLHDKNLDRRPAARDELLGWAERTAAELGRGALTHDAVVHGIRVRLVTNSPHQHDFFVRNWYTPESWRAGTGRSSPAEPHLVAYAFIDIPGRPEAAYYSRERGVVLFTNSSYYGQLKSWVLGAVGRLLSEERGIHSIHGACVELEGKGILYVAPTGTGKSTSSYGLMELPGTRFHSDDWVYVRYAIPARGGRIVAPTLLPGPHGPMRGFEAIQLLLGQETGRGAYEGYDLNGNEVSGDVAELELDAPLSAYAYTSERHFYLRSNLVESFAPAADALLGSVFENIPDVSPGFLHNQAALLDSLAAELRVVGNGPAGSEAPAAMLLARMVAFDNARAMLDTTKVFGAKRVFTNPMEPTRLSTVFLLERNFGTDWVMRPLEDVTFLGVLLDGATPSGSRETAYNAYRAVDDADERSYIDELSSATDPASLGRAFQMRAADAPATLRAEMTLFSALHRATHCYSLNTILQRDPTVGSRKEAVRRTLALIAAAARGEAIHPVNISNYDDLI